ncbi:hypothetical protein F5Y11DRAFT_13136 [Daldinia sp. FL1419]|nr:hypothetical protein F5Y11DRAFT_13136 [Daldinia sp. FL1419]
MSGGEVDNWWYQHQPEGWKFPKMPTKREIIYILFRAAYPQGAFVDDNLKMVELRDKQEIWHNIQREISTARADLNPLIDAIHQTFGISQREQDTLKAYYEMVLDDAESSLYTSQNGRYLEFRCMEELLVRYKTDSRLTWALHTAKPGFQLPHLGAYRYAADALEPGANTKLYFETARYLNKGREVCYPCPWRASGWC